jgi:hypothetical protein
MSSTDVTDSIRLGMETDFYYVDSECAKKSVYRALTNNRFTLSAPSGSNPSGDIQFVFNSLEGLQDVVMRLVCPAAPFATNTLVALCKGWGYRSIDRVTYRIGNLPEQYQSGSQILFQNLIDCPDQASKEALYALGGSPLIGGSAPSGDQLEAYVPLNFPWSKATSVGKPRPLPTDLLLSPVILRINLVPLGQIISSAGGVYTDGWASMSVRFRQVVMEMKDNLLKNRTPASAVYSLPLKYYAQFVQQTQVQQAGAGPGGAFPTQTYNLTGFRNGRIKKILFYVTRNPGGGDAIDNLTYAMRDVQLLFNGDVLYQTQGAESQCWSLISARSPPVVSDSVLVYSPTAGQWQQTPINDNYLVVDLAQVLDTEHDATTAIGGLKIDNAILNLSFSCPAAGAEPAAQYRLNSVYLYECTGLFSMGSCDFVW